MGPDVLDDILNEVDGENLGFRLNSLTMLRILRRGPPYRHYLDHLELV